MATSTTWPAWNQLYTLTSGTGSSATVVVTTTTHGGGGTAATVQTWKAWNVVYTDANTTVISNSITSGMASTITSSNIDPWIPWNSSLFARGGGITPRITNEEYQARRRQQEERRVIVEGEKARARERAQVLLREHLTDAQKAELADKRFFSLSTIDSKTGEERLYRIHQGRAGNVEQVDASGRRLKKFCIHPQIDCPDEDTMLAQKLWLETQEDRFLQVANHSL